VALANRFIGGGLHPNVAPQNSSLPYGVYIEILSPTENTLDNNVPIQQSILQIDIWDQTFSAAKTTGDSLVAALTEAFQAGILTGLQRGRRSRYDAATKRHGFTYEYSFWYH